MSLDTRWRSVIFRFSLFSLLVEACICSTLLPDKLHSISRVTLYNQDGPVKSLTINEFVDPGQSKSSLEIRDHGLNATQVVFNFPTTSRPLYFLAYSVEDNSCSLYKPQDLSIDKMRQAAEMVLAEHEKLDEAFVGPTALLKAIESCPEEFRYVQSDASDTLPGLGFIFQKVVSSHPNLEPGKSLIVLVRLKSAGNSIFALSGKNLDDMKENLEYMSATTCLVASASVKDAERRFFCKQSEISMEINYFLMADMVLGSHVGRLLEPKAERYNFEADPFTQPVGIGCWLNKTMRGRKKFMAPGVQFSAEYETLTGGSDVSFMAYDQDKKLVRMDRRGRKNVYDLEQRISAHSNEADSVLDLMLLPDVVMHECLVLEMHEDPRFPESFSMINLLGVGTDAQQSATHLGSRFIDHIRYELYEQRVNSSEIPLIMNMNPDTLDSHLIYFVTYYVEEYVYVTKVVTPSADDYVSVPKFMELWSYEPVSRTGSLLELITFAEFSWAIDVYPDEDAEALRALNLFSVPDCAEQESTRVDVSFLIKSKDVIGETLTGERAQVFRQSRHQLIDQISNHLSEYLRLSHMNIIGLRLAFKPRNSTNLFVDAHLSTLETGHITGTEPGYVSYRDFVEKLEPEAVSVDTRSYQLAECQLDSVMSKGANYAIYCERQTTCAILWKEDLDLKDKIIKHGLAQQNSSAADCYVHDLKWNQVFTEREFMLTRVRNNYDRLAESEVRLEIKTRDKAKQRQFIRYSGKVSGAALKVLDWFISREERSQLVGVRYLVKGELRQADGHSYNLQLKLPVSVDSPEEADQLRQCQLACQTDNYCQSFSVCISGPRAGECVLSTLIIDSDHIPVLQGSRISYILNPFNETYETAPDSGCNIHPREILPGYRHNHTIHLADHVTTEFCPTIPLEACALMNHEKWLNSLEGPTNFVYCPITSCCVVNEEWAFKSRPDNGQECQVYTRSFSEPFKKMSFMRMELDNVDEPSRYMKLYGQVDDEECARLCRSRHSNCLAYDTCRVEAGQSEHPLCILYSVTSPLATHTIDGYLSEPSSRLVGSASCHHRAITGLYSTIRSNGTYTARSDLTGDHIYELDSQIREVAYQKSQNFVGLLRQTPETEGESAYPQRGEQSGSSYSTLVLAAGVILGTMGFLFHDTALERTRDLWNRFSMNSHGMQRLNSDIDLLNIPEDDPDA